MAYSLDYRQRVFRIKEEEDLTYKQISKRFGIGMRTLFRWKHRLEPQKTRDKPATKIKMAALKRDVEENPDRYQHERAQDYGVSQEAIFYALKRLKVSCKKNVFSSEGQ